MSNEEFVDYSLELESNDVPIAVVLPAEQEVVVGAIVRLDGRSSIDPNGSGLTYSWSFVQVPIGSQVESFGFTNFEDDASIVGFAPDITGTYKVHLIVNDGSLDSEPSEALVDVRVILVPNHQGYVPDASFIWNYLSDFWTQVPDRKRYETFWSAAIQVTASEMLKLYQYQYNKSIRDIQETIQKRWLSFSPSLDLDRSTISFILADDAAGSNAATFVINSGSGIPEVAQPSYSNVVTVPLTEGNFSRTSFGSTVSVGRVLQLEDRSYTLARANDVFQSINYGVDGATSGTVTFTGTQFTAAMVGATLRILSPSSSTLLGDYIIASYVSPTEVTVSAIHPGTTWPGSTNLTYTVIPATVQGSSFFADQLQVPAGLDSQHWRLSATLLSSELDFEAQGVSIGDIIEVEVTRLDLRVLSNFYIQVVSVDRNRLGFVMNLEDLVAGTAAEGLTEDIQVTLAADLIVPGLSSNPDGSLSYSFQAAQVKSVVESVAFKRTYYEQELEADSEINVGPFSINVRPVRIIRNRKMAIDDAFISVPILQEYVKQPDIIEDGDQIYLLSNGIKREVARKPYLLSENLDYIIDDESTITGSAVVVAGSDEITIPLGDLIDRSVKEGDTIEINIGNTFEVFDIRRVTSAETLRVYPTPTIGTTAGLFTLTRRISGKFLRFVDGTFSKTSPAPTRLWSEISYLDNGDAIEGNFGVLVGVRREDLERVGSGIPYKSAVAGLMYALSNGPTISNLTLSAQILIGLPFAQNAGVIKEINPGFRKREDGSPLYGRILIDGRDRFNQPTGVTNIYFYPEGRQVYDAVTDTWSPAVPDFSGIAINPDSGSEYTVGDAVTQFAPLSKGVKIEEYLTDPSWIDVLVAQGSLSAIIQKYHAFQVVVNSDLVTSVDVDLVAQFMKRVKAHYVRLISVLLKSLEDVVEIEDVLSFGRTQYFFDASDLGSPTAVMLDPQDDNEAYVSLPDGVLYTRLHQALDLQTTYGTPVVTSAGGGFIDARIAEVESWLAPKVRAGDLLTITTGSNFGTYTIDSVNSDGQVTLTGSGTSNFETLGSQRFFIHRPLKNPIFVGKAIVENGNTVVEVLESNSDPGSIDTTGVSVGDILVFADLSLINPTISRQYTIAAVAPDLLHPKVTLSEQPVELNGVYDVWIIREGVATNGIVQPYGTTESFRIVTTASSPYLVFTDVAAGDNSLNIALLRPGSTIDIGGTVYTVIWFEAANRRALVTPTPASNATVTDATVYLRPDMGTTPVTVDFLDRMPGDMVELEIQASETTGDLANTSTSSTDVTLTVETPLTIGALPGDYFILLDGADSLVDVGAGTGAYVIHQIVGGTTIRLADQLTATGAFRYGLRRKVPNEG